MTDVNAAALRGRDLLEARLNQISSTFSYEETAYYIPVSYALTGITVNDKTTAGRDS